MIHVTDLGVKTSKSQVLRPEETLVDNIDGITPSGLSASDAKILGNAFIRQEALRASLESAQRELNRSC